MPRNYIKKTSGPKYTKDDLKKAVSEVENGSTIYAASKKFSIPQQTLRRWVVKCPSHQGQGRCPYLTNEEEMYIVVALQFLRQCGFLFDRRDVIRLVETYLTTNQAAQLLFPNGKPGVEWIRGFEKRWEKELGKKKPKIFTKARAVDLNEESTTAFFNTYEKLLYDNGLHDEPDRIFNFIETGLSTDPRSTKVFFRKNQHIAYMKSAGCGKAVYTVLFCIAATGVYLPPFVVYKGQHLNESWTAGGPPKALYGVSDSGWMLDSLFESWMAHFVDFVKNRKKPVLLLYNGHGSHLTYNTIKQAIDNGIIIYCLPPNCRHALQPLDDGMFSPMKKVWKEILIHWFQESCLQNVSKASFPCLLKKLFEKMKPENAVKGFKAAGLYPLNKKAIEHHILGTGMNNIGEYAKTDSYSSIASSEAVFLNSSLKDLNEIMLQTPSPKPSVNTVLAIENSKKRRKRVQSKNGMFTSSAQSRSWMFKSSSELNKRREYANLKFIKEHSKGMSEDSIKKFFLAPQEERVLYKHYESILLKFCQKFQPPMPKNVVGCSFHYFKRFYLNNSVMDYHPKDIVVTCVYLASKVEEFNVSIAQFVANVRGDREKATEIILNHELLLMQQLNFDLSVYNPYRPVEGFLIDIKTRYTELFDPEHLRPAIEEFLDKIQFTDACFLYSPSQIALAAIAYGTSNFKESIDGYLSDILFDGQPEKLAYARDAIKTMYTMIKNEALHVIDPIRAGLEKKLEKCRNQENNPSSAAYKRKLEEIDEDEDIEPAQKYSRLLELVHENVLQSEKIPQLGSFDMETG